MTLEPKRSARLAVQALALALAAPAAYAVLALVGGSRRGFTPSPLWALFLVLPPAAVIVGGRALLAIVDGPRPHPGLRLAVLAVLLGAAGTACIPTVYSGILGEGRMYRNIARENTCLSNVKQLQLAVLTYSQDYDERAPLAASWNEALLSPGRGGGRLRAAFMECPSEPVAGLPSYAMNRAVAGTDLQALSSPEKLVAVFESKPGRSMAGGPELLPTEPRHEGGDNIAFADGHAKYLRRGSDQMGWTPSPTSSRPAAPSDAARTTP